MNLMRNYALAPVLLLLLVAAFAVPPAAAENAPDGKLNIVCADSVLADFTSSIVGDLANVEYIMPAGICPAHFDSRPSNVEMVASADIIIQLGWEGWLNNLIESSGNGDVSRIKCTGLDEWNIPEGAKAHVDIIAEGLGDIIADHADTIAANAGAYKARIDAKAAELQAQVVAEGVAGSKVVCMQWQSAFVEWLGFEVVTTYGPPESLSVTDQLNVTGEASRDDVVMVVDNLQSGTDFGAQVASETGSIHVILTNFPSAYPNTYTYLDMIEYNTNKLVEGVKTYEYKKGDIATLERRVEDLEFQNTMFVTLAGVFLLLSVFMGALFWRARSRGE